MSVLNAFLKEDVKKAHWQSAPVAGGTVTANCGKHTLHTETPETEKYIFPLAGEANAVDANFSLPVIGKGEVITAAFGWFYCKAEAGKQFKIAVATKTMSGGAIIVMSTVAEWHSYTLTEGQIGELYLESGKASVAQAFEALPEVEQPATRVYAMYLEIVTNTPSEELVMIV